VLRGVDKSNPRQPDSIKFRPKEEKAMDRQVRRNKLETQLFFD
jgi:hypothetical protein